MTKKKMINLLLAALEDMVEAGSVVLKAENEEKDLDKPLEKLCFSGLRGSSVLLLVHAEKDRRKQEKKQKKAGEDTETAGGCEECIHEDKSADEFPCRVCTRNFMDMSKKK